MMKFLDSKQLDIEKWDKLVSSSGVNNVFCYSWYLAATCKKWGAIVTENYDFGMPLPYKNWVFYKKIFQHPFSRNLAYFGDAEHLKEAVKIILSFDHFLFCFNHPLELKFRVKKYQQLALKQEIQYKKNTTRILSKNQGFYQFKMSDNIEPVLDFYFTNSFHKIRQPSKNKKFLTRLLEQALKNQKGETIEVYNREKQLCGAGFYLFDKETVCYLIGDCDVAQKKNGLMFSLMDFAINHYREQAYEIFDFGGSNVESVAAFYKKMGGQDQEYFEYYK